MSWMPRAASPRTATRAVTPIAAAAPAGLLAAIADGTFGSMKRPPTKGKGLDGVVRKADGYLNPATDLLEMGETR